MTAACWPTVSLSMPLMVMNGRRVAVSWPTSKSMPSSGSTGTWMREAQAQDQPLAFFGGAEADAFDLQHLLVARRRRRQPCC